MILCVQCLRGFAECTCAFCFGCFDLIALQREAEVIFEDHHVSDADIEFPEVYQTLLVFIYLFILICFDAILFILFSVE